jgi:ABC-2 type transport system ATP-binding protein
LKQEIVRTKESGAAVLVSTHLLDTAEKLCDRVLIMARGRLLAEGSVEELREHYGLAGQSLEDVFLSLTNEVS